MKASFLLLSLLAALLVAPVYATPYDDAVKAIEAQYPSLNPDLPQYNDAQAKRVLARKDELVASGYTPEQAIRTAAGREMLADTFFPALSQSGSKAVMVVLLIFAGLFIVRLLWQLTRTAARKSAAVADVASHGAARAAGYAARKVADKSTGLAESFRRGVDDARKRQP